MLLYGRKKVKSGTCILIFSTQTSLEVDSFLTIPAIQFDFILAGCIHFILLMCSLKTARSQSGSQTILGLGLRL